MEFKFDPIEDILEEIRQGHIVIMQDAESRENEGDYICAAEFATPENVNRMASEAKGVICMPMSEEIAESLYLGPMIRHNTDNHQTAFLESIDYKDAAKLRRFVSERSKILPRRTTGTCAMHQRQLTEAIKRARQIALLPFVTD